MQTQVLPYLREIKKLNDLKISLLTFEINPKKTWTSEQIDKERERLANEGIDWYFLTYHKTPSVPATFFDVLNGAFFIWKLMWRKKFDILHARVHIPMMMGVIARKFSRQKPKIIFDIRGFFPEEYTDAGRWKENGLLYKSVKWIEKWLLKEANAFVVLTEKAKKILFPESEKTNIDKHGRSIEVIPCCVNLKNFTVTDSNLRKNMRKKLHLQERTVITYVGSLGGWYLTEETLDFLASAREEDKSVFALIITQHDVEQIVTKLKEKGFSEHDFLVTKLEPYEIPAYLNAADIALSFIKKCYSKQASSPTKIAEYLASGLPVVSNSGIGDLDELIEIDNVGALIKGFNKEDYYKGLQQINKLKQKENLAEICKACADRRFDLEEIGGKKYRGLYNKLLTPGN